VEEFENFVTYPSNYLFVISAPSGAGKSTLCQKLLADFPNLIPSISSTTRAPRGNEQNGREYFFLSHSDFEKKVKEGQFAEWALVHGNYYGTSKDVIQSAFDSNRSVLLDIDVQGAEQLLQSYPTQSVLIFIAPPSLDVLEARLRARGTDSEATIQKRLKNARTELAESGKFHHIIINDSLEKAYQELKQLLENKIQAESKRS
jgi:guanylate kinase